jgi:PAS domain S-box-containing protein
MAGTRILIVEDEGVVAQRIATTLTESGYIVAALASSGEQAIQQATETRPDLVLMDIDLEGEIDAKEVVERIHTRVDIPVVYLTAHADDENLQRAQVTEPYGYVTKPFEDRELRDAIEMALYKHKIEARLKESEARYHALSELTSDLTYTLTVEPDGRLLVDEWLTEAFVRTTGFTPEEIAARGGWTGLIYPDDAPVVERHIQILVSGQPHVCEFRTVTKGGEVHWLRNHGQPVWDKVEDRVVRIIGAARDITERKQVEIKIRRRHERLNVLNTISAAAVSSLDSDAVMHQILELTCQTLDADGGSMLLSEPQTGGLFFAVVAGSNIDALRGMRLAPGQGIAGWVADHRQSTRVNDARHDPRWYNGIDMATGFQTHSLMCTPLVYHEEVSGVIEIVNKREGEFTDDDLGLLEAVASIAAAALENARLYMTTRARVEELALLHEMGLALSSTLDPATVIHVALNQIMRLFQADKVSLFETDSQTGELRSVKALLRPKATENLASGTLENDVVEWSTEHGPTLIEDVQNDPRFSDRPDRHSGDQARALMAAPLRTPGDAAGIVVVVSSDPSIYTREELYILQTITSTLTVALQNARLYKALKELSEERERTQAHLIQTEKLAALGRLVASLAHEINNPLQALRSAFRLLSSHHPTEEKRQTYLDLANQELERLVGIVERILGFHRPSGGEPRATDINATLGETLLLVGKQLEHSRVTVHRQLSAELPPVEAVADQLKQVFLNIVLNALHAMPEGGKLIVVTDWDAGMGEVRVAFTDTGVGIPDEEMPRLFEPFFTSRADGTGLGLAISYGIVERHGGRIEVESQVGMGSTFTVILPAGEGLLEGEHHGDQEKHA